MPSPTVPEVLARVAAEHGYDAEYGDYGEVLWAGCACGHEHGWDEHAAHVAGAQATALAEAGLTPAYTERVEFDCSCAECWAANLLAANPDGIPFAFSRMHLCSTCGNKRCPRAISHKWKCSGSNDVIQHDPIPSNEVPPPHRP